MFCIRHVHHLFLTQKILLRKEKAHEINLYYIKLVINFELIIKFNN